MACKEERKQEKRNGIESNREGDVSQDDTDNNIPIPPDGGWGWVIVFSSMMCNLIVDGLVYAFGIFLPEFVDYFDAPRSKVSLIGSLLCGVYLCVGPIVSGLINKFGCRPVVMAGSLVSAIAFIAAMFSPTIDVMIVTYGAFGGIGFGMIYLPSIVSVGYYFERRRALATGIAVCGSGIGTFIFAPLTKFLLDKFDWKNALFIVSGIVLNGCVFGALMRPLETGKKKMIIESNSGDAVSAADVTIRNGINTDINPTEKNTLKDMQRIDIPCRTKTIGQSKEMYEKQSLIKHGIAQKHIEAEIGEIDNRNSIDIKNNGKSYSKNGKEKRNNCEGSGNNGIDNISKKHFGLPEEVHAHEVQPLIRVGTAGVYHSQPNAARAIINRSGALTSSHHNLNGSMRNISSKDYSRPMYRKDIFYSGSIVNIAEYKSQPDVEGYISSIISIPDIFGATESKLHKLCSCLPKPMVDSMSEMLDVSLFTNCGFMCLCLGNFFALGGYLVPFVYLVDRAILAGIERTQASFLLSVIGITATIGRLFAGALADLKFVNSLVLNNICMLVAGISIFLSPCAESYAMLVVLACGFGLASAAFISLTSIIICDLLGLEKLTNAFGLLTLARGVSVVIGPPVAGAVFQSTGSYDESFYLGGSLFIAGALLHSVLLLPCMKSKRREPDKDRNKSNDKEGEEVLH